MEEKNIIDFMQEGVNQFTKYPQLFIVMGLLLYAIPQLIISFVQSYIWDALLGAQLQQMQSFNFNQILGLLPIIAIAVLLSVGMTIIYLLFYAFLKTFIITTIAKKQPTQKTITESFQQFFFVFIMSVLMSVALIFLYVLFIIPGIYVHVLWIFTLNALIIEKKGIMQAFKSSYNLVKNRWWQTFGFVLILFVFNILVSLFSSGIFMLALMPLTFLAPALSENIYMIITTLIQMLLLIYTTIVVQIWYQEWSNLSKKIVKKKVISK